MGEARLEATGLAHLVRSAPAERPLYTAQNGEMFPDEQHGLWSIWRSPAGESPALTNFLNLMGFRKGDDHSSSLVSPAERSDNRR
jgi:hypothetical protein